MPRFKGAGGGAGPAAARVIRRLGPPDQQDRRDVARGRRNPVPALDMSVRERQRWLRAQGYNIAVDGIWGPMSKSAFRALRSGVVARRWNEKAAPVEEPERTATHVTPNNQRDVPNRPQRAAVRRLQPHRTAAPTRVRSGKTGKTVMPRRAAGSPIMPGIDDEAYANALIEAEYGPVAAELARQEQRARNIGDNRVAEIQDMYNAYTGRVEAGNVQAATERNAMVARTQGLPAAIAAGVPISEAVAAELAARGDIEGDYAGQIASSASQADQRAAEAARAGGVFAAEQARREQIAALDELGGKRSDLTRERGAKLSATKEELRRWRVEQSMKERELNASIASDRTKNQLALLELAAAQQGMGLDSAKTRAELEYIRSQTAQNWAGISGQREERALNRQKTLADIAYTRKQTRIAGRSKTRPAERVPRNFVELNPAERLELQNQIISGVQGMSSNTKAIEAINSRLRALGYKPRANRRVGQFAFDTARAAGLSVDRRWWGL